MEKARTLGTKRWVCAILVCALLLTTPSLALAASAPEQTAAAQPLTLESIPDELAQTLELDELSPLAELNDTDEEQLNSLTISNGDGTSTAYIFQGPIKYFDKETNSIQFIDNKLKVSDKSSGFLEKYAYENTANDIKVYLPKKIKKGVDMEYENISINMRPEIINNEKGVLKEYAFAGETMEVMEYPDAFGEGYHLQYQPLNSGLKENILVEEYNGTNSFSFELKLKKGSAEISEDNRIIYIKDENGETVFILNQPYARDSYVGIDPELSHRTFDDYYILEQTGNKTYRITMVIDSEFLAGEDTVYPVLIDPTATISSGSISDVTALSNDNSYNPSSESSTVGYFNGIFYTTYQKNTFIWYYRFMNPANVTNMVHKAYVSSLTNIGIISVYDSTDKLTVDTDLKYSDILNSRGTLVSSRQISGQGWYEFDITDLGREWLKYETRNYGTETGKSAEYGYSFFSSGPGVIILASADSSSNSAYVSFNYTEDTSLADGTYIIKNKLTGRAMQDNGSPASLGYYNPAQTNQQWIFTKDSNGFYTIKNVNTGRYIYFSGVTISGSVLQTGSTQMQWRVLKNDDGSYRLFPNNCIYAIEERWYNDYDYKVYAEGYNCYINQRWDLVPVADQVAVKLPNGTYIQRSKTIYDDNGNVDVEYKNESGVALEVNDSKQIIIEPIVITDITASGDNWHKSVAAPFTYSVTGSDKISVSRSGNTLTITGQALGEASITVTSGDAQTTIPVVVANKVLDVPLERQVWNQSCWAACGSMVIKGMISSFNYPLQLADDAHNNDENYPAYNDTQYDIIEKVKGSRIKNTTNNKPASSDDIINALKNVSGNEISGVKVEAENFSQTLLRQKLDAGSPVIYLTRKYNSYSSEWTGHFRVIYGYYWLESAEKYVYLVCDPWNTCMKYNENTIGNNVHLDIWRRSWENILDEKEKGISGLDIAVTSSYLTFYTREFIYFDLL